MTANDVDRIATWALQRAGCAVRGPLRTALLTGYPLLTRDEVTTVIDRAFALGGERRPAAARDAGDPPPVRKAAPAPAAPEPAVQASRGVGKKLSRQAREKLRKDLRALIRDDSDITQKAAYDALQPSITFWSFRRHFQAVAGKRPGNGAAPPEPSAPAAPDPELELAPPPGRTIGVTTPLGTFTAEPDPDGMWHIRFSARGDLRSMLQVGAVALEALHQPVPS